MLTSLSELCLVYLFFYFTAAAVAVWLLSFACSCAHCKMCSMTVSPKPPWKVCLGTSQFSRIIQRNTENLHKLILTIRVVRCWIKTLLQLIFFWTKIWYPQGKLRLNFPALYFKPYVFMLICILVFFLTHQSLGYLPTVATLRPWVILQCDWVNLYKNN